MDGHIPATKINHFGSCVDVLCIYWCALTHENCPCKEIRKRRHSTDSGAAGTVPRIHLERESISPSVASGKPGDHGFERTPAVQH